MTEFVLSQAEKKRRNAMMGHRMRSTWKRQLADNTEIESTTVVPNGIHTDPRTARQHRRAVSSKCSLRSTGPLLYTPVSGVGSLVWMKGKNIG